MILLAGEIALALHRAIILALGLVQDDAHPLPGGEERVADVRHRATLPLPDHLHQGAHFDGPPAPVRAHPAAAAAGCLGGTRKKKTENSAVKKAGDFYVLSDSLGIIYRYFMLKLIICCCVLVF